MQEFVRHISCMLNKVRPIALQRRVQTHGTVFDNEVLVQTRRDICSGAQKQTRADEIDNAIEILVLAGHDICHTIPPKLEQLFISRGMLSFLQMLSKHHLPIAQDRCMQLWKTSIDSISLMMLAQARLRFGEQHNVYELRNVVRLRRINLDLSSTTKHDMLQNNHPFIALQNGILHIRNSTHYYQPLYHRWHIADHKSRTNDPDSIHGSSRGVSSTNLRCFVPRACIPLLSSAFLAFVHHPSHMAHATIAVLNLGPEGLS